MDIVERIGCAQSGAQLKMGWIPGHDGRPNPTSELDLNDEEIDINGCQ